VVTPDHWRAWRDLRLEGLLDTPIGFGRLHAEEVLLTDANWREAMLRPGRRVMAYDDGQAVGMAGGFVPDDGRPTLFAVYVTPAARGRGVLGALVDDVMAWCAPLPLRLDVHEDNHRAHAAYLKLGFVDTGVRTVGGGIDGRDLIQMVRP
jgi:GNAT superfamily N-acetyltransferase